MFEKKAMAVFIFGLFLTSIFSIDSVRSNTACEECFNKLCAETKGFDKSRCFDIVVKNDCKVTCSHLCTVAEATSTGIQCTRKDMDNYECKNYCETNPETPCYGWMYIREFGNRQERRGNMTIDCEQFISGKNPQDRPENVDKFPSWPTIVHN